MKTLEMNENEKLALQLFAEAEYAFLATVNADGTPYCVPMSLVEDNGFIYLHGAKNGQKIDNFRMNKNVSLSCVSYTKLRPEKFSTDFDSAVLSGEVEIIEDEEEMLRAITKIGEKYCAPNRENVPKAIKAWWEKLGIYKIHIKTISARVKRY